jgi:hypothetical protein
MSRKTKKVVEHRWFPSTTHCGLLGGIVAPTQEVAERWGTCELFSEHKDFKLVRVRMEYEIPVAAKRKRG